MRNDVVIIFLLFLSFNIIIYVALLRWASQINDIVKNLESINDKLDMLTGLTIKFYEQESGIETHATPKNGDLH